MRVALIILLLAVPTVAQDVSKPLDLAPGVRHDSRIPNLKQAVGQDFGEKMSTPEQIVAYMKALAAAAPNRARVVEYGRTWEGRPLILVALGSSERIGRIDAIQKDPAAGILG